MWQAAPLNAPLGERLPTQNYRSALNDVLGQMERSMIEMLGVLDIIGVLSIGGISGYSKAMMKYKLNKQTDQLVQIIPAVNRYEDYGTHNAIYTLIQMRELPEEMIKGEMSLIDIFNNRISTWCDSIGLNLAYDIDAESTYN